LTKTEIEINGPYLMCPKTDGMTVACETDRKMDADFFYGSGDSLDRKANFPYAGKQTTARMELPHIISIQPA
jgi:hypothetical protein